MAVRLHFHTKLCVSKPSIFAELYSTVRRYQARCAFRWKPFNLIFCSFVHNWRSYFYLACGVLSLRFNSAFKSCGGRISKDETLLTSGISFLRDSEGSLVWDIWKLCVQLISTQLTNFFVNQYWLYWHMGWKKCCSYYYYFHSIIGLETLELKLIWQKWTVFVRSIIRMTLIPKIQKWFCLNINLSRMQSYNFKFTITNFPWNTLSPPFFSIFML